MAHEGLWEQLEKLDGQQTARRAKCKYVTNPQRYIISLLNSEYVVNLADKQIFSDQNSSEPAGFLEQLCLLTYLINAKDLTLADKLVRAEALPGGQFFFRGIHCLPTKQLEKAFGQCPERLHKVSEQFEAKKCEFGDASIELYVLPRLPLTIVIWRRDKEFDARASILFDQTVSEHLPLDALWTAVNLAIEVLVKASAAGN